MPPSRSYATSRSSGTRAADQLQWNGSRNWDLQGSFAAGTGELWRQRQPRRVDWRSKKGETVIGAESDAHHDDDTERIGGPSSASTEASFEACDVEPPKCLQQQQQGNPDTTLEQSNELKCKPAHEYQSLPNLWAHSQEGFQATSLLPAPFQGHDNESVWRIFDTSGQQESHLMPQMPEIPIWDFGSQGIPLPIASLVDLTHLWPAVQMIQTQPLPILHQHQQFPEGQQQLLTDPHLNWHPVTPQNLNVSAPCPSDVTSPLVPRTQAARGRLKNRRLRAPGDEKALGNKSEDSPLCSTEASVSVGELTFANLSNLGEKCDMQEVTSPTLHSNMSNFDTGEQSRNSSWRFNAAATSFVPQAAIGVAGMASPQATSSNIFGWDMVSPSTEVASLTGRSKNSGCGPFALPFEIDFEVREEPNPQDAAHELCLQLDAYDAEVAPTPASPKVCSDKSQSIESVQALLVPEGVSFSKSGKPSYRRDFMLRMCGVLHNCDSKLGVNDKGLHTQPKPVSDEADADSRTTPLWRRTAAAGAASSESLRGTGFDKRQTLQQQRSNHHHSKIVKPTVGFKACSPSSREEELSRLVRGQLNRICPSNLQTIVDHLAAVELRSGSDLNIFIKIIFSKALSEPHYCETYADMVFKLRHRLPEFPPDEENGKPVTFHRALLTACQEEFEKMPGCLEESDSDDEDDEQGFSPAQITSELLAVRHLRRKQRLLANMKFIGHLFLRRLLAVKVIGTIVHELVGVREEDPDFFPAEHAVEATCELLQAIGHTMDSSPDGKKLMCFFLSHLQSLSTATIGVRNLARHRLSRRARFQIQDLSELRASGWVKKVFREQAQTKEEIRKQAVGSSQSWSSKSTYVTAGRRPSYVEPPRQPQEFLEKFSRAEALRLVGMFAEESSEEALLSDWVQATRGVEERIADGAGWILRIGLSDPARRLASADVLGSLLLRRVLSWRIFVGELLPQLERLEDTLLDEPQAEVFFHKLFAKLLSAAPSDLNFDWILLRDPKQWTPRLLFGALKLIEAQSTPVAAQRCLQMQPSAMTLLRVSEASLPVPLAYWIPDN